MKQSRIMLLMGATALVAAAGGFEASHGPAGLPSPAAPAFAAGTAQPLSDSVDVAPAALHNMDLHLATADVQPLVQTVRTTGVVAFNDLRMAQLSPPARGRIQSIEVAVGQPVRAGQRLALLDNFDLGDTRSHIAAAQASLVQARARLPGPMPRRAPARPNCSSGRRPSSGKCRRDHKMHRPATSPRSSRARRTPAA